MAKRAVHPANKRTFALLGHRSSGKTSLAEVLLKTAGVTRRIGRVDDRTSLLDSDPAERRHAMTLGLGFAWYEWNERIFQLVDTPGSIGLCYERSLAITGSDGVVVVLSAPDGVESGTEIAIAEARARRLPCVVVVNKLDRGMDAARIMEDLSTISQARVLPLQLPFHDDDGQLQGVISLAEMKVFRYDSDREGTYSPEPIPERYRDEAERAREKIVETVALSDDRLLERYLEFLELPPEEVVEGLARAVRAGAILPVLFASAATAIGAHGLLDAVEALFPTADARDLPTARDLDGQEVTVVPDGPFSAQLLATAFDDEGAPFHVLRVWSGTPPRNGRWLNGRTGMVSRVGKLYQLRGLRRKLAVDVGAGDVVATWDRLEGRPGATFTGLERFVLPTPRPLAPMMAYLVTPLSRRDEENLPRALEELLRFDAMLEVRQDDLTGGIVLAGHGQVHLERHIERLKERFGVEVAASLPPVAYRETPSSSVANVRGLYRKRTGKDGLEYGECWLDVAALPPQDGIRFVDAVPEGDFPKRFVPPIDEGIREAIRHGPTAGYPVVGVGVRCVGGEYDILFSTEDHFRIAGARALRTALQKAGTDILEPWRTLDVDVFSDEVGPVLAEIQARRGRILGMEIDGRRARITAQIPARETRSLAPRLQALTGGRGRFVETGTHYEKLPAFLRKEAIAQSPYRDLRKRENAENGATADRTDAEDRVAERTQG